MVQLIPLFQPLATSKFAQTDSRWSYAESRIRARTGIRLIRACIITVRTGLRLIRTLILTVRTGLRLTRTLFLQFLDEHHVQGLLFE